MKTEEKICTLLNKEAAIFQIVDFMMNEKG